MTVRLSHLSQNLPAAGQPAEVFAFEEGCRILVLPYGGRVLGLFSAGSEENFLWTNPALESAGSARALVESQEWPNTGGDRTWLAPEIDIFFPRYPDLTLYVQPRQLDPANYSIEIQDGRPRLTSRATLRLFRTGTEVDISLVKTVSPAAHPLRVAGTDVDLAVEYAGYTLESEIQVHESRGARSAIGLWALLQLPLGGEFLIPTPRRAHPGLFFGHIDEADLRVSDSLIRYRTGAAGEHKFGLPPDELTGQAAYRYSDGESTCLVVRSFPVDSAGLYVDVPWSDPLAAGAAFQACNINGRFGQFSELEYHAPAIAVGTGAIGGGAVHRSVVSAFRGSPEAIDRVALTLLGG